MEMTYENYGDDAVIINFDGELSYRESRDFDECIRMFSRSFKNVILDLSKLSYLDSAILNVIVKMIRRMNLHIIAPENTSARTIIEIINLARVVPVHNSKKEILDILKLEEHGHGETNSGC